MWSQVKNLSANIKQKMSRKADEIALEAISATQMELESDQRVVPAGSEGDDESSIEALSWSDFDEEELEIAKELAEKEFPAVVQEPSSSSTNVYDNNTISTSQTSEAITLTKDSGEESPPSSVLTSISSSQILNDIENISDITEIMKEEQENDKKIMDVDGAMSNSTLSVTNCCGSGEGDKSSNAAVLDDGPIWGKGAKSYKFHENQKINQKLTFGVLMSIVMAVGVGLGNLVAVEFDPVKPIEQQRCPVPLHSSPIQMNTPTKNTLYEKATVSKTPTDYPSTPQHSDRMDVVPNTLNGAYPYVISHTETLAQVVKSIDELSKKIDQFENTTRQLSGIIIMKDDLKTQKGSLAGKGHEYPNKKNTMANEEFSRFLPTFNDDLSSWEKASGAQLMKQPNIKEGCEKMPKQDRNSFKEAAKIVSDTDDDGVQIEVDDMNSDIVDDVPVAPQPREKKLDSQDIEKHGEEIQKKQKNQQKIFAEQKDKKKKNGKLDRDAEQEDQHVHQKSKGKELKVEKMKILKQKEPEEEQREWHEKKKNGKKQGKDKKVKRERSMESEPEKQQTFDDGLEIKLNHEKAKNVKVKSGKDGSIKVKKVKGDSRRKSEVKIQKDNSNFHAGESLPELNTNHKVKRSVEGGNPEERTYHRGDEDSELDERRHFGKPSSKYPKYKKKNKNEYQSADQKDWTSERAKIRENQRVQQNWNSDFNGENQIKIKRKKNWQIERDRVREKIRKVDTS